MELTSIQRFFLISGIGFWYIVAILVIGFIAYLIVKDVPEPKGKAIDLSRLEFDSYDKNGRKLHRRDLHESMKRGRRA